MSRSGRSVSDILRTLKQDARDVARGVYRPPRVVVHKDGPHHTMFEVREPKVDERSKKDSRAKKYISSPDTTDMADIPRFDFDSVCQYPSKDKLVDPPETYDWSFVGCTYLNGLINYVQPHTAFLFRGYYTEESWDELERIWTEEFENGSHPHLGKYPGRLAVVAESARHHWMFLYDHDVSDCRIARLLRKGEGFVPAETFEKVGWERHAHYGNRDEWLKYWENEFQHLEMRSVPLGGFFGWVSF